MSLSLSSFNPMTWTMAALGTNLTSLLTLGGNLYMGYQAQKNQDKAIKQNEAEMQAQFDQAQRAINAANAPKANASFITQAQKGGPSATTLTGPQGIDTSSLLLGKSTLLGM